MHTYTSFRRWIPGILAVVFLLGCLLMPAVLAEGSNGMETTRYDVNAVADTAHTFHITETITVNFTTPHHGILRYIPMDPDIYEIRHIKVPSDPVDLSWSNDEVEIRIGDEDEEILGEHQYTIEYEMDCYRDDSEEVDYLSLNLLPTDWETPIGQSTLSLTMPTEPDWSAVAVYSGSYGSTGNSGFTASFDGTQAVFTGTDIPARSGLTLIGDLPENYWSDARTYLQAHRSALNWFLGIASGMALLMLLLWFLFGREPHMVKPVEFTPPEDLTPLEIGYMIDGVADDADFMSMILYFASKGYLEVRETKKDDVFELAKLRPIDSSEPDFAVTLFNGLFGHGDTVKTSKLAGKYGPTVDTARKQLLQHFSGKDKKLFRSSGSVCRIVGFLFMMVLAVIPFLLSRTAAVGFMVGFLLALVGLALLCSAYEYRYSRKHSTTFLLSLAGGVMIALMIMLPMLSLHGLVPDWILLVYGVSGVVITLSTVFMSAHTDQAAKMEGRILGFRNFIRVAEYDQLKRLSDENPQYFYKILPYAAVMGLQTKWAKKFTDIPLQAPDWYRCEGPFQYSTWWAMNMVNHCCVDSAPNRAGSGGSGGGYSGGFSGGGFAGGGFGGGGGGGW